MSSAALRREIEAAFSGVGLDNVDPDILSKCVGLSKSFHISPEQLAIAWEAFSLNSNINELTDHTFQGYRASVTKNAEQQGDDPAIIPRSGLGKRHTPDSSQFRTPQPSKRNVSDRDTPKSAVDNVASVSISPKQVTPTPPTPANLPSYGDRTGAGKVIVTFNPKDLPPMEDEASSKSRCIVSTKDFSSTNVSKPYRHMFTTLEERGEALDLHLRKMGEEMIERYDIGKSDGIAALEAVGVPRQEKVCCIGRICNEAHEGRINQTSVLLEGDRHSTGGKRVNVDLSELKSSKTSFSLFPGQIVAVEGMNVSGRKIVAHRICEGSAKKPTKTTVEELLHLHHDVQDGKPLKVMSVCGPYTASDNLEYEPLDDLLAVISAEKPDVVILAGPFVDMRHPAVLSGETVLQGDDGTKQYVAHETFFAIKIAALLEQYFGGDEDAMVDDTGSTDVRTQFVLVPSLDDAVAEWVYPQAPLADRLPNGGKAIKLPKAEGIEFGTLGLHHIENAGGGSSKDAPRVHLVSNPCTLKINELVIGLTATDSLFHISADETNGNLEPGSRLGRIAQHLIQQQSYYPLFPAPASPSMSVNLDLKHMEQWNMPCQPDLLVVPSKLTCFARTVLDKTVVVNPGQLTKGTTGGTYALMEIHPFKRETLENAGGNDVQMEHALPDRIRVEIKRI